MVPSVGRKDVSYNLPSVGECVERSFATIIRTNLSEEDHAIVCARGPLEGCSFPTPPASGDADAALQSTWMSSREKAHADASATMQLRKGVPEAVQTATARQIHKDAGVEAGGNG